MNAHEKRQFTFKNKFQYDPKFGKNVFTPDMVESKVIDKAVKAYAGDVDVDSIIGLYNPKKNNKGKRGLVFTDYKIYCNLKKARNKKIWYDEIKKIKVKLFNRKKVVVFLDDGNKVVLKTTRRISKKIIEFVNDIREYNDEVGEYTGSISYNSHPETNVAMIPGIEAARREIMVRGFDEEKFHAQQGHGFAAEQANNLIDRFQGKNATVLNETVKDGPDRKILHQNGTVEWIQTKYCQSATESINHCFNENGFRYLDGNGNPMSIEVPSDQYEQAVEIMQDKIKKGLVNGVTDPKKAKDIVRKGHITYKQAVNIAKAGTIESITYDAVNGMVVSASAFGISAVVSLATSIWNGDEFNVAIKRAASTGVKVGGASFLTSVLAAQLSKAGLNSALVGSTEAITKALGSKASAAIVNAFRGSAGNIYGAAAMKSAAKLLRTNIITSIIAVVVFSIGDFINLLRRRITFKQFIKNFVVLALSIAASVGAGIGGAALGTFIFPGVGSAIVSFIFAVGGGALAGFAGKKLLGLFIKDDAEEMVKIIEEEFKIISEDYLLSRNESEKIVDKLTRKLSLKVMRKMVASKDRHEYARNLILPLTEDQVKKRKKIKEPSREIMIESMNQLIAESQVQESMA